MDVWMNGRTIHKEEVIIYFENARTGVSGRERKGKLASSVEWERCGP